MKKKLITTLTVALVAAATAAFAAETPKKTTNVTTCETETLSRTADGTAWTTQARMQTTGGLSAITDHLTKQPGQVVAKVVCRNPQGDDYSFEFRK